ncbi:hypothetical protein Mgra_00010204 [Meloidogyne graminicola]|uniref:Uncharacterized protein n=1 Tax=Meloidogyne graminicola TaxID=189291 RepID=A0A8S9ZA33_9BILA|nr:hypothetical protein Mgra_00010204 [Meloidogyne graminicola]
MLPFNIFVVDQKSNIITNNNQNNNRDLTINNNNNCSINLFKNETNNSINLHPSIGNNFNYRRRSASSSSRPSIQKSDNNIPPLLVKRQGMQEKIPSSNKIIMTRSDQLVSQEGLLRRQNSDPSPTTKRKPKLEIFTSSMKSPNHNSTQNLFAQTLNSPIYRPNIDNDLLTVPRCGASPSVGSFQSDPESCLDGLQFKYIGTYGEDEYEDFEPFSIGRFLI